MPADMNLPLEFLALRERFLARLPERLQALRQRLAEYQQGNTAALLELRRLSHSLVGAAGLHTLTELAEQAASIEALAEAGAAAAAIDAALDRLQEAIAKTTTAPKEERAGKNRNASIGLLFENHDEMVSQSALLAGAGYTVHRYQDFAALEAAITQGAVPDLLLMGLLFNNDSEAGVKYLQRLQQLAFKAPVAVVSASRSIDSRLAARKAGAATVLYKPLSARSLIRCADEMLARRSTATLTVLVLVAPGGDLPPLLQRCRSAALEFVVCDGTDKLRPMLLQQPFDAIVLQDNRADEATTTALISLLNDDPDATHLPKLLYSVHADAKRQARALTAGCKALVDESWQAPELLILLQGLCQAYSRQRQEADAAMLGHYEYARQGEALGQHAIISLADAEGNVFETSPRHSALTGYARTELIGANLGLQRPSMAPPEFDAAILAQVRTGNIWQGEYPLACKTGAPCWVGSTLVPFLDVAGNIYQYMVIRTDITERKQSEAVLARARASELAIATQIQETLLLPPLPSCPAGIPLAAAFTAAEGVAGDFHALVVHSPDCFDLMVGDVMGKGIAAALVGAAVKMEYGNCLRDLQMQCPGRLAEPVEIVAALRQRLTARLIELECFVTLSYLRCDRASQTLTSVGCGHPEIIVSDGATTVVLPNQQLPIGITEAETGSQTLTRWPSGASVLVYSDGLSETTSPQGEVLEPALLQQFMATALGTSSHPLQTTATLLALVDAYAGGQQPRDDRSLVVLQLPQPGETCVALDNSLSALTPLRETLQELTTAALMLADVDRLVLAGVEVFSNIVRHAKSPAARIALQVRCSADVVSVAFVYPGQPFTPPTTTSVMPAPEQLGEGGLGLLLIEALCDSVHYHHLHGINTITLSLSAAARAASAGDQT